MEVVLTPGYVLAFVSAMGIIIAGFLNYWQYKQMTKQVEVQVFSNYTDRYQKIIWYFPESINNEDFRVNELPSKDEIKKQDTDTKGSYESVMRNMRTYFNICFEEFYLAQGDYIDDNIWQMWKEGIQSALQKKAFREAWQKIKQDTKYSEDFIDFIEKTAYADDEN